MADNSFDARAELEVGGRTYEIYRLDALQSKFDVARLPFSLKILLENLLRNEDGVGVRARGHRGARHVGPQRRAVARRSPSRPRAWCCRTSPACPCVVDLAAMRDAMADLGGDPAKINPLVPAELVIDHSVQVDAFGTARRVPHQRRDASSSATRSATRSCAGARRAFEDFKVVPPDTGIVHQVNLEYLARVVFENDGVAATPTRSSAPTRTRR